MNWPALLVGLHKLIPAILFLVYASEVQELDENVREHHDDGSHIECTGNTDHLHQALTGRSGLGMLSAGVGICLLVDTVIFAIRFGFLKKASLRGKLEQLNHLFEFFTCAMATAVLHTVSQSEQGLGVQALYADAGCQGDYSSHLEHGVALVGVAYFLVCFEFLIVRVQGLALIPLVGGRLQGFFADVAGPSGGCDANEGSRAEQEAFIGDRYFDRKM